MNKYFILCHIATEDTDCEESWSYLKAWSNTEIGEWHNSYDNYDLGQAKDVVNDLMDGYFDENDFPYLFDNLKDAKDAVILFKATDTEDHRTFKYYIVETVVKVIPDYSKKVIKA